ncbi:hypothetical protein ABZP36_021864 [Zizania latifolia]
MLLLFQSGDEGRLQRRGRGWAAAAAATGGVPAVRSAASAAAATGVAASAATEAVTNARGSVAVNTAGGASAQKLFWDCAALVAAGSGGSSGSDDGCGSPASPSPLQSFFTIRLK